MRHTLLATVLVALFALTATPAYARAITHVGSACASGTTTATTTGFNTSGASLIVAFVGGWTDAGSFALTDNQSNTWTALTAFDTGDVKGRLYYVLSPATNASHTFTNTSNSGKKPYVCVAAFSGTATASAFGQQNGSATASETSGTTGSITPGENNEVVVTGAYIHAYTAAAPTLSGGSLTRSANSPTADGNGIAAIGYEIQTTATARNATWGYSGTRSRSLAIASFKEAGGGGGGSPTIVPATINAPIRGGGR